MTETEVHETDTFQPGAKMQRISQQPGFIAWQPGDPFPDTLRKELNLKPFLQAIRQLALTEREVQP